MRCSSNIISVLISHLVQLLVNDWKERSDERLSYPINNFDDKDQ